MKALSSSRKECERLKAELAADRDRPTDVAQLGAVTTERDTLRRELENLKRSTDSELGDLRMDRDTYKVLQQHDCDQIGWLQRELDRERSKRKRGL
jgi:hypothetical protein